MAENNIPSIPSTSRSGYVIPKRDDEELFKELDLNSLEWKTNRGQLLTDHFILPDSKQRFIINNVKWVKNKPAVERYREKKREIMNSKESETVKEIVGFIGCTRQDVCHQICSEGLKVGNVQFTHLGKAKMGVVVLKHPDVLFAYPFDSNTTYYLIILKILQGKTKHVPENSSNLEPSPGYDCHVVKRNPTENKIPNQNIKQIYYHSQMYLYEYEMDGLNERPRQIFPSAVVEFKYFDPTQPVNVPAKLNAAISTTPKAVNIRNTFCVWKGQLVNDKTLIANVNLISHGVAFKPTALGKKINLLSMLSLNEMKERYLKNINKLSVKQEFHNGRYYMSYFQLLNQDSSPGFDQLVNYLETMAKAVIFYCGNRVEGVIAAPKTTALGVLNTQHSENSLHCFFAAQHSLESRLKLAREMVMKNQVIKAKSTVPFVARKSKLACANPVSINFDDAFPTDRPLDLKIDGRTLSNAFLKQAIDYQIRYPEMIAPFIPEVRLPSAINVYPPLSEKLQPKRVLLPTPCIDPIIRQPPKPKLDPRIKTIPTPPVSIQNEMLIPPSPPLPPLPPIPQLPPRPPSRTRYTAYSPTQFSPLGDNVEDELERIFGKTTPQEPNVAPSFDGNSVPHRSTNDDFFDKVGQYQDARQVDSSIPFLDDVVLNNANIAAMKRSVDQPTTNGLQAVTYGSIHSVDAMKSYLNASINKMKRTNSNEVDTQTATNQLPTTNDSMLNINPTPRNMAVKHSISENRRKSSSDLPDVSTKRMKIDENRPVLTTRPESSVNSDPRLVETNCEQQPKRKVEKEIEKAVKNAVADFRDKINVKISKDLPLLKWGNEENQKNRSNDEINITNGTCNEPWKLNPLKLSSFTTIYNQENKTERSDEKVNEIKNDVLGFTDELMKKFGHQTTDDQLFSDQENVDLTCETLNEEMENFYKILAEIIPIDEQIRSALHRKLCRSKPQFGRLHKLKCIANVLNESLSDKYLNCLLKCEFKKFARLAENIFSSLFIISCDSQNVSSKEVIKDRYCEFQDSLHNLMSKYGLSDESDEEVVKDNVMSKSSILDKLNHPNVFIDSILNEKRTELSNILDGIASDKTGKKKRRNGAKYRTSTPKTKTKKAPFSMAHGIKRLVSKKGAVKLDSAKCYAQLRKCLVKYRHLKEAEKDEILHRSIKRHCETPLCSSKRVSRKQRQLRNSLLHLGSALTEMCTGGPLQMRKLLTSQGENLSALLEQLAQEVKNIASPVERKEVKLVENKTEDKAEDDSDTRDTVQLTNQDVNEELFDSLPDAVKNGASVVPDVVKEVMPKPSFHNYKYLDQLEPIDAVVDPTTYEQPVLPIEDTLYFVYGNAEGQCNDVKAYLNSMRHRQYGSNNKETVAAAERGVVLYVFVHSGMADEPHAIPDLLALKELPKSNFMLFDTVEDLTSANCRTIFDTGGIIVPDKKLLLNSSSMILTHAFSLIKKKLEADSVSWTFYIHSNIIQELENLKENRGLSEHSNSFNKATGLLNEIKVKQKDFVYVMDTHECDKERVVSAECTLNCLRNVQRQNMSSCRHIVFVSGNSDLQCTDQLAFQLAQSGISVMPLLDLIRRYLKTDMRVARE